MNGGALPQAWRLDDCMRVCGGTARPIRPRGRDGYKDRILGLPHPDLRVASRSTVAAAAGHGGAACIAAASSGMPGWWPRAEVVLPGSLIDNGIANRAQ
jgi:hypothetical protein